MGLLVRVCLAGIGRALSAGSHLGVQTAGLGQDSLDLGGGLGVPYKVGEVLPSPADYGAMVARVTREQVDLAHAFRSSLDPLIDAALQGLPADTSHEALTLAIEAALDAEVTLYGITPGGVAMGRQAANRKSSRAGHNKAERCARAFIGEILAWTLDGRWIRYSHCTLGAPI